MTEPMPRHETCSACHTVRDVDEMLIVTETGGLHRSKYICRPNADPRCFTSIGPRSGEAIALALPQPPPSANPERQADRVDESVRLARVTRR